LPVGFYNILIFEISIYQRNNWSNEQIFDSLHIYIDILVNQVLEFYWTFSLSLTTIKACRYLISCSFLSIHPDHAFHFSDRPIFSFSDLFCSFSGLLFFTRKSVVISCICFYIYCFVTLVTPHYWPRLFYEREVEGSNLHPTHDDPLTVPFPHIHCR
jgi:hypothetical protein